MEQQLIDLLMKTDAPLTVILIILMWLRIEQLTRKISKMDGKLCIILKLLNLNGEEDAEE